MIILREFKVWENDSARWLTLDLQANPSLVDSGAYIKAVVLSTTGSFSGSDPTVEFFNNLLNNEDPQENAINQYTGEPIVWDNTLTELRVTLDVTNRGEVPFFMEASGPIEVTLSCGYHRSITAATYYKYPLYKSLACMAKQLDSCTPSKGLTDLFMRISALEASINIGDYGAAATYFNWLIKNGVSCGSKPSVSSSTNSGCGCH